MSNKIEIYLNNELFKSFDTDKVSDLYDAKSIAHKFMRDRFKEYSPDDICISIMQRYDGSNRVKIKIKSKELTRDIILEGILKDGFI